MSTFKIWRTLAIGGRTLQELKDGIQEPFKISDYAQDITQEGLLITLPFIQEIRLVKVSIPELGFDPKSIYPHTEEIYHRALEWGLYECPPEVGLWLRPQYTDQPRDECITVAMKQIVDSYGKPRSFWLVREWLGTNYTPQDAAWHYASQLIFSADNIELPAITSIKE